MRAPASRSAPANQPTGLRQFVRRRPVAISACLTVVSYGLVLGTFLGVIPYPQLNPQVLEGFTHAIAVINTLALGLVLLGWYWIRRALVDRHRWAMLTAFGLILLFLALYLVKVGGGGTKEIVAPALVRDFAYLPMLTIHLVLSILAVPLVIFVALLGLTHTPAELSRTRHPQIGRIAVMSWGISLFLGIITYVMLNHIYGWQYAAPLL